MTTSDHIDAYRDVLKQIQTLRERREHLGRSHVYDYNNGYHMALDNLESWLEHEIEEYNSTFIEKAYQVNKK